MLKFRLTATSSARLRVLIWLLEGLHLRSRIAFGSELVSRCFREYSIEVLTISTCQADRRQICDIRKRTSSTVSWTRLTAQPCHLSHQRQTSALRHLGSIQASQCRFAYSSCWMLAILLMTLRNSARDTSYVPNLMADSGITLTTFKPLPATLADASAS